jgi:hypothetical protein
MVEFTKENYTISTDRSRLDLQAIHHFLSTQAYWAINRSYETVQTSVENSLCFGMYAADRQIGFCRVVTDHITLRTFYEENKVQLFRKDFVYLRNDVLPIVLEL